MAQEVKSVIGSGLALVGVKVAETASIEVRPSVNHIVIVDASGSTYGFIDDVADQLVNKLPDQVQDGDTFSGLWFSGRGEFGVFADGVKVSSLSDFASLAKSIKSSLRARGLTCFADVLKASKGMVERLSANGGVNSLWFMTDGMDNQSNKSDILKMCEALSAYVGTATVMEFGYYTDRTLLNNMAVTLGGTHIFAKDFKDYEPLFDAHMKGKSVKRKPVSISGTPRKGVVFGVNGDVYAVANGVANVPENLENVYYLTDDASPVSGKVSLTDTTPLYSALAVFAQAQAPEVFPLLKATGDVTFINAYTNCFGKQAYNQFVALSQEAVLNPALRLVNGYNPDLVPAEDAPTVLDALYILMGEEGVKLHTKNEAWTYDRIGRKAVNKADVVTEEEKTRIATIMAGVTDVASLKAAQAEIENITAKQDNKATFKGEDTSYVTSITFNEDRPNVSIKTKQNGVVTLPENSYGISTVNLFRFRDYTIIKDGILNTAVLPVSISKAGFDKLAAIGAVTGEYADVVIVDLSKLPLINRKSVKSVTAVGTATLAVKIMQNKAKNKILKGFITEYAPKETSAGFKSVYGDEAGEWLATVGVKDGGFNPPVTLAPATDVYMSKELETKIAGYSTPASIADVQKAKAKGKFNGPQSLVAAYVDAIDAKRLALSADEFDKWLKAEQKTVEEEKNALMRQMANIKFSIIVGQTGFTDTTEDSVIIKVDGVDYTVSFVFSEKEVAI